MNVLVVDVGGSHVKLLASGQDEPRRFDSGPDLTPRGLIDGVHGLTADWAFDVIALGYPGRVGPKGPVAEPGNLGNGWVGFDFEEAFGRPVRVANDAILQALGGYEGGRMLFLGLGTGLGSALIAERVAIPLELGDLEVGPDERLSDRLGKAGLERLGEDTWRGELAKTVTSLRAAFLADYVMLGGGNVHLVEPLPEGARRGGNDDAFRGGFRLWEEDVEPHDRAPSPTWRVVR